MGNIYDQLIDAPAATSPAQSTPSKYDDLIESDLNTQRQQFKSTMMTAIGANPQSAAKAHRVAKATGVPFDTAERNTAELENTVKLQEIQRLAAQNPVLAKQLTDPVFAKMSHQDAVNLSGFEGTFKTLWNDVIKPTPVRAWSAYQQGVGGMYQWIGEAAVQPVINAFTSEETRKKYGSSNILTNFGIGLRDDARFVDEYLQKEHPLDPNSWAGASASALQSMYLQAPFMAIGSLAGTARNATATTLGLMGLTTGGQTYGERRERGFSPAASGLSAALDATVEVGTELMPMGTLFDMMKPAAKHSFGRLAGKMVELYGEEMVGESLATLFQDLNDKFMTKPDMTMKERVDQMSQYFSSGEAMQNWINTLKSTAVQTTLMGGAGVGINRLQQGRLAREQAQHQLLVDALTKAELSQLKSESPDTFAQFAQNTAEHYGAPTIYFQADKLITAAVQQGLTEQQIPEYLAQYGVTESQLQEAVHTGGLIGLETGKFATYFQNDPVLQSLQNDFVIDPNAHSRAEAENGVQLDMETMKHLNELYQADQNHKINQDDIAAWEEAILNQPGLKGKVTTDSLMPVVARANVLAQLTGVPAIEHLNRMLQPTGLQAMKFADYEARKKNKAANAKYDFDTVYDSLVDEGDKTVLKGKGNKGNWSESEFSKHLEQFYPAVHSLYLMHGHNKSQILAALKNAKDGKPLNDNHAAIIQAFKDDMDNYAEQQTEEDDYPFQQDRKQAKQGAVMGQSNQHPFAATTREEFLGNPKITKDSNASGLKPRAISSVSAVDPQPFMDEYQIRMNEDGAAVYDGDKVIASYNFGDTLVVDKKYRRKGIGEELVYQWRMANPQSVPAKERTRASQALQEKVWSRIARERQTLFQSPNSRTGNETYSIRKTAAEGMLAPAVLKDGKILAAGIGATHYDVHTEVGQAKGREDANGFVTPDGKFLDRKESLQWLKENRPDVYRALDKETKQNGLESQAYAHAEGLGGDLADEAQRYMESLGLFQSSHRDTEAFKRFSNNAPFISSEDAMQHQFKSGEKVVVEAYHGTARPDRVGTRFQKKRATSGPMSFFTSDPELASGYAQGKQDTSLAGEDQNYANWFKFKPKGSRSTVDIERAWYFLTPDQKQTIYDRMGDIRTDDDDNIIYEEGGGDIGPYQWELKQTQRGYDRRGNPLKAAVETWLNSGTLFNEEERFMKVLELAGFPMADLKYDSPHAAYPAVYKTYVAMQSPLVTDDIPQDVVDALNVAAKKDRSRAKQYGADAWDKNTRTLKEWVAEFSKEDNQYVWTSIPDKVTDVFKSLGYDGIVDVGGKNGGKEHKVYIPFEENQVKSAMGNKGTYSLDSNNILFQSAWHGSPHTFDKFSTSAIGTGEGAQAYGYGLYFAGAREVAEWYKNKLSNSKVFYKGQDYQAISKELPQEAYSALSVVQTYGSIDAAIESIRGRKGETATKIANWLEQNKQDVTFDNAGRLYKVELAPAEDEYLLWDKPLSEQSEKVKAALKDIGGFTKSFHGRELDSYGGAGIYNMLSDAIKGGFFDKGLERRGITKTDPRAAASEYLHSLGIRGIKYEDGNTRNKDEKQYNYVIFSDDDVAITEMYQKQQAMNNPLGALNTANGVNIVSLFEGADKSTFLHETAHIFLNDLRYVAETYGVQQKEWEAVRVWLGVGEDNEVAREQHEMFAEHFEKYLMEGKAPSIELRNAFRSFKRWLTKIYEGIKSYRKGQRDNVTVTPELADLFGRLMATEQQIQAAREHDALVGMLDANMMADVGDSQSMIDEYRKLLAQSDDSAREKMDKHKLVGSEQRKTEFRKQAQEEVKAIPVYAFVDKVVAEGGINRQSVEAILGKENTPNLPHLWRNDGLDVNVAVAEHGAEHGFNSAGDLAAALQQMEPRQLWVDKRVAQLEAIHDTTLDSQEAIRTAALRRMLEIESEWLAKRAVKQTVTPRATMRAWADKTIAGRTMREINNVGKLLAESRKHRQQAILEARQGKWEEALAANEKARLTEELIAASYRAIKTNKAIESNVNKVKNATRVKSGEAAKVGESWRKQIDRLLDQYGIAKRDYDPAMSNLHDFAASKIDDFDGTGAALPGWIGTEVGDFNKLTFEQRQEFNDALKYLYGNGRDEVRGRKLANGEAVADKAAEIAARQDGIKNKPELMSDATAAGRVIQKVQKNYRKFFANTGILRFIAKRMDGYSKEMGPAEQLVQDIINGMAASNDMWVAIQKEVEPALQILMKDGDKVFSDITWPELLRNEGASWNKARVVAAALNMGNDSNMMKLLDGYGLTQDDASNIASKLTAEEWQAIQKIWDTVDSLWPQIADVHERLKYFRPKKIEARGMTITTADGQQITLKGGYYPIKYDARFTRKIAEWSEKDDLLASHEAIMQVPAAKSGFSKERTGVAYPVDLSLNVLAGHFNDTIRFITLAEKVRDADRVFRNDTLMTRNLETMGRDMVDMIRPTLKQVIRPEASKVSPWFERSRVAMSMYYMGYNAWTAIQNITGVFPAIKQAGAANYMNGIMHVIANPLAAHKAMLEASSYMRLRSANVERDMKKQLREFNIGGMEINGKRYTYDDVKSLGFAGIRLLDGVVALPAWWGKYNAEMEQHGDVKKATEAADAAINNALGSGLAIDSTGFQRHPFLSLLAPFMSFASTQQEVLATERQAWKEGKIGNSEFLYGHLMTWVAPAVMSTFLQGMLMYGIMGAIGGGDDDKKKKDWSDYIGDLISYRLMGIPFLRDVFNGVKQGFDNKAPVTSARMPVTEGFKMVQQLGYRVGNLDGSEKKTKAAMWSAAELASLASGVPATRIYDRWQKGTKQIENGTGWWGNHFVPQEKKK